MNDRVAGRHRRASPYRRQSRSQEEIAMVKLSFVALALAASLGVAGMTAPAFAASVASCQSEKVLGPNRKWIDRVDANAVGIAMELRQRGYRVESVQGW